MWTTVAYYRVVPTVEEMVYLTPVFDDHVRVEDPNIIVPDELPYLAGVLVERGTAILLDDRAQVESPSLRRTLLRDVTAQYLIGPFDKYIGWDNMFFNPIPLDPREPLRVKANNTDTASKAVCAYVFLADGPQSSVGGEIYTVLATTEGIVDAGVWSTLKLNFTQVLPAGRYQLVGAKVIYSQGGVYRFVFVGQAWRPGGIVSYGFSTIEPDTFRRGTLGVWGEFTHDQPPALQIFSTMGGAGVIAYLDLIKVE